MNKKEAMNNYLIVAFSGQENGMLGSKHFIEQSVVSMSKINCVLNFDQVGRLNEQKQLTLNGTGTSPKWSSLLDQVESSELTIQRNKSGLGYSDHTPFYLRNIPVLNFSSGENAKGHQFDHVSKIDFNGLLLISNYAEKLLSSLDQVLKLSFLPTEDSSQRISWEDRLEMND